MLNDKANEFYRDLKLLAQGGETLLNAFIQKWLNQEELTHFVGRNSKVAFELVNKLQKYQELITSVLKIPTKDDVANVAKLVLNSDDKLDLIEEQFHKLKNNLGHNYMEKAKVLVDTLDKINEKLESNVYLLSLLEIEKEQEKLSPKEELINFLKEQTKIKLQQSMEEIEEEKTKIKENFLNQDILNAFIKGLKKRG